MKRKSTIVNAFCQYKVKNSRPNEN